MQKILIIGAGLAGSVIARELANKGHICDIIDRRKHIGGNCYDYTNDHGIRKNKYGPHFFHTNNIEVFRWLSQFTMWTKYQHKVKAMLKGGRFVTLPVNRETARIVGKDNIIDIFYKPYTTKMWGKYEVDESILNRVKIRDDDNELYFPDDKYQFIPKDGYTEMFENILNHKNIRINLNRSYFNENKYDHIFNSMSIDEYYGYKYGMLPYRSIKFSDIDMPMDTFLPAVTVNFTHYGKYTRVTEWSNLPNNTAKNITTATFEEPCDYKDNNLERYYPIKEKKNAELYNKYAEIKKNKMTFIGRCGQYKYLDMDEVVEDSLKIADTFK